MYLYEDAIQYFTAIQADTDILLTRNLRDFPGDDLPVMDPASYLK